MPLAKIHAVWVGDRLGPVHAACLKSFLRHGHHVTLHVYQKPIDVPDGVQIADAAALLPARDIVRYKNGSPAIFSDFLRYEILAKGLGLYVDCDVYCVCPIEDAEWILGWESYASINNAVLKMPADCPVLAEMRALRKRRNFVPPWFARDRQAYYMALHLLGRRRKVESLPWGATGPHALTWYMRQYDLIAKAQPCDVFYPNANSQFAMLFDNAITLNDIITRRTLTIHLWHARWGKGNTVFGWSVPINAQGGIIGALARGENLVHVTRQMQGTTVAEARSSRCTAPRPR